MIEPKVIEAFKKLAIDPGRLKLAKDILSDPDKAIASLTLLINHPNTPDDARRRYQGVRNSLENFKAKHESQLTRLRNAAALKQGETNDSHEHEGSTQG